MLIQENNYLVYLWSRNIYIFVSCWLDYTSLHHTQQLVGGNPILESFHRNRCHPWNIILHLLLWSFFCQHFLLFSFWVAVITRENTVNLLSWNTAKKTTLLCKSKTKKSIGNKYTVFFCVKIKLGNNKSSTIAMDISAQTKS